MKKKTLILTISLIFLLFVFIGSVIIGQTDNRLIFTLKNNIPLGLRVFLKDKVFFIFSLNNEVEKLIVQSKRLVNKVDQLEDQNEYLKQKIYNISNQIDDDVYVLPKILGNEELYLIMVKFFI